MAEDEGRARRIADLKAQNPRLTWAKIADHVGVTERSAIKWQKTGALDTENAEKLAEIFGVDFDYVWFGPRPDTPEMFVDRRNNGRAPEIHDELADILGEIRAQLTEQNQVLAEIKEEQARLRALIDGTDELRRLAREIVRGRPTAEPDPPRAPKRPATAKTTRAASQRKR